MVVALKWEQRSVRPSPRLVLCATAVVAVHAAALLHRTSDAPHFASSSTAMSVRSLEQAAPASVQTLAPLEIATALRPAALKPLPQNEVALPGAPGETASHEDAAAPELRFPDAALPGGEARAQVALSLAVDGFVEGLAIAPHALPPAFEKAIQHAFAGSKLSLEQRGGRLGGGKLCIEVHFREGALPDWQRVDPRGTCAA